MIANQSSPTWDAKRRRRAEMPAHAARHSKLHKIYNDRSNLVRSEGANTKNRMMIMYQGKKSNEIHGIMDSNKMMPLNPGLVNIVLFLLVNLWTGNTFLTL